jgi:hypothetical protein
MRTLVSTFGPLFALALAGCFSADVDVPEVCIGGLAIPVPPASADIEAEDTISADELGVPDSEDFDLGVQVRSVSITPVQGVDDLSFLDHISVIAAPADPGSSLPEVVLIDMDAGDLQADGSLRSEPSPRPELADHLRAGEVLFRVEMAGDRPDHMWMADMELCVHASGSYQF